MDGPSCATCKPTRARSVVSGTRAVSLHLARRATLAFDASKIAISPPSSSHESASDSTVSAICPRAERSRRCCRRHCCCCAVYALRGGWGFAVVVVGRTCSRAALECFETPKNAALDVSPCVARRSAPAEKHLREGSSRACVTIRMISDHANVPRRRQAWRTACASRASSGIARACRRWCSSRGRGGRRAR